MQYRAAGADRHQQKSLQNRQAPDTMERTAGIREQKTVIGGHAEGIQAASACMQARSWPGGEGHRTSMRMFFAKLSYGCLIAALAFNLYFPAARFMSGDPYPGLFGLRQAVVLSNSMTPALQTGDLIIIREAASYSSGDILTYRDRQALVTHRLVEAGDKGLVLQGDANRTPDGLVQQEQILGRLVLRIPGVGQLSLWLREMGRMIGRTIALARP